jgi:hypothetical protein
MSESMKTLHTLCCVIVTDHDLGFVIYWVGMCCTGGSHGATGAAAIAGVAVGLMPEQAIRGATLTGGCTLCQVRVFKCLVCSKFV